MATTSDDCRTLNNCAANELCVAGRCVMDRCAGVMCPAGQVCWNGEGNNVGRGARKSTCEVGSFPAGKSPFGLLDMAGNVMEWTSSGYSDDYDRDRSEGTRVVRGGSWEHGNPNSVRAALRTRSGVESRVRHLVGFRCAQSIP
jgi:formylglycine-generating enzyme required for sulfatase activity